MFFTKETNKHCKVTVAIRTDKLAERLFPCIDYWVNHRKAHGYLLWLCDIYTPLPSNALAAVVNIRGGERGGSYICFSQWRCFGPFLRVCLEPLNSNIHPGWQ